MRKLIPFLLAVSFTCQIDTTTTQGQAIWWVVGGPLSESTTTVPAPQAPIIQSQDSGDCYQLTVTPNGTLGTTWVGCPSSSTTSDLALPSAFFVPMNEGGYNSPKRETFIHCWLELQDVLHNSFPGNEFLIVHKDFDIGYPVGWLKVPGIRYRGNFIYRRPFRPRMPMGFLDQELREAA